MKPQNKDGLSDNQSKNDKKSDDLVMKQWPLTRAFVVEVLVKGPA